MTIWRPWRALRARQELLFKLTALPPTLGGAALVTYRDREFVVIDKDLTQVERKVALAHELVHHERGPVVTDPDQPDLWGVMTRREEEAVDQIVAVRLVPPTMLNDWLERRDEPTTASEVAEEFEVTDAVAVRALRRLQANSV